MIFFLIFSIGKFSIISQVKQKKTARYGMRKKITELPTSLILAQSA